MVQFDKYKQDQIESNIYTCTWNYQEKLEIKIVINTVYYVRHTSVECLIESSENVRADEVLVFTFNNVIILLMIILFIYMNRITLFYVIDFPDHKISTFVFDICDC